MYVHLTKELLYLGHFSNILVPNYIDIILQEMLKAVVLNNLKLAI